MGQSAKKNAKRRASKATAATTTAANQPPAPRPATDASRSKLKKLENGKLPASGAGGGFWGGDRPDDRSAAGPPSAMAPEELQLIDMGFRLPDIQRTLKHV